MVHVRTVCMCEILVTYSIIVVCTLTCMYSACINLYLHPPQAEQYAVIATPTPHRKAFDGEVTTDEEIPGREKKGLLDEHLQIATAQTKFT